MNSWFMIIENMYVCIYIPRILILVSNYHLPLKKTTTNNAGILGEVADSKAGAWTVQEEPRHLMVLDYYFLT